MRRQTDLRQHWLTGGVERACVIIGRAKIEQNLRMIADNINIFRGRCCILEHICTYCAESTTALRQDQEINLLTQEL